MNDTGPRVIPGGPRRRHLRLLRTRRTGALRLLLRLLLLRLLLLLAAAPTTTPASAAPIGRRRRRGGRPVRQGQQPRLLLGLVARLSSAGG